jgi:hypothetical protein
MSEDFDREKRRTPRWDIETELDINIDPDTLEATSVNLSDTGIRFDTPRPLQIDVRFTIEDRQVSHTGRLVWAKKKPDGGFTYGFEYIRDD